MNTKVEQSDFDLRKNNNHVRNFENYKKNKGNGLRKGGITQS